MAGFSTVEVGSLGSRAAIFFLGLHGHYVHVLSCHCICICVVALVLSSIVGCPGPR
jgi:hypothetical protein